VTYGSSSQLVKPLSRRLSSPGPRRPDYRTLAHRYKKARLLAAGPRGRLPLRHALGRSTIPERWSAHEKGVNPMRHPPCWTPSPRTHPTLAILLSAILSIPIVLVSTSLAASVRSYCSLTTINYPIRGVFQVALRPVPNSGAGTADSPLLETWFAFVTLSPRVGCESVGEIWQGRNQCGFVTTSPLPILRDETCAVSYVDPAWSPDGNWLAYVATDNDLTHSSIYVQQFDGTPDAVTSVTPLGAPILIADGSAGIHNRHPAWSPSGGQIAYDSDAFGPSIDLWTVNIALDPVAHTGTVNEASRTRHLLGLEGDPASLAILNGKAEFHPAYSPDGTKIAYVTNRFGLFQIQIVTLTASGFGETSVGAETNPAFVTHDHPAWSSDGLSLFYDAPAPEDPGYPTVVWYLDLETRTKIQVTLLPTTSLDIDVSRLANVTADGRPFHYVAFHSGGNILRGTFLPDRPPIARAGGPYAGVVGIRVALDGSASSDPDGDPLGYLWDLGDGGSAVGASASQAYAASGDFQIILRVFDREIFAYDTTSCAIGSALDARAFIPDGRTIPVGAGPPATCIQLEPVAADYENELVDLSTLVLVSEGTGSVDRIPAVAGKVSAEVDRDRNGVMEISACFRREDLGLLFSGIQDRTTVAASLEGALVTGAPIHAPVELTLEGLEDGGAALLSPNPVRPGSVLLFRTAQAGPVVVRLFGARGNLVRTLMRTSVARAGYQEARLDGRDERGAELPSGIYFYRIETPGRDVTGRFVLVR